MIDHLIDRGNLRDLGIALVIGLALAALLFMVKSAHAQGAATMGLIEQGVSMAQSLATQRVYEHAGAGDAQPTGRTAGGANATLRTLSYWL